jgi:predicted CXXCH cytochrome family protein
MQCTTCHTPHAVSFEEGLQFTFFLRKANNNSSFCKECHVEKVGGLEKGNHPIDIDIKKVPELITKAGGKLGKGPTPTIICETCHTSHGGVSNQRLILSVEDPLSRSVLCEACHGKSPLQVKSATAPRFSHPVDVPPGKSAQIPKKWSNGEEVFRGKNGVLVCRTCHKPHQALEKKVLLADHNVRNSICIECHPGKDAIKDSSHDLQRSAPNEKNIQGARAAEIGVCSPCHLIHQGTARYMWAQPLKNPIKSPDDFCLSCHSKGASAEKAVPKDFSHPMGIKTTSQATSSQLPLYDEQGNTVRNGVIRCLTCHDIHNPHPVRESAEKKGLKQGMFLRLAKSQPSEVCIACHAQQGKIEGTDHDLRVTAPSYKNMLGQTVQGGGMCSACHAAHNAPLKPYLWAAPSGPTKLDAWKSQPNCPDSIMIKLCTGCHAPGKSAEQKIPQLALHPAAIGSSSSAQQTAAMTINYDFMTDQYPLYTNTGEKKDSGFIVCSTCHNPHVWKSSSEKGPGVKVEGNSTNSFLRENILAKFCVRCHGEEGPTKFLYFHRQLSREKKEKQFPVLKDIR